MAAHNEATLLNEVDPDARSPRLRPWTLWLYGVPAAVVLFGALHLYGRGPFQPVAAALSTEAELERQIVQLKFENEELSAEIKSLKPGAFGIEKRAREKLGWSKPGEIIIHIPNKR